MTIDLRRAGARALLGLIVFLILAPVAFMAVTSVKPMGQLDRILPSGLTLDSYAYVLKSIPFWSMAWNTLAMAVLQTLLQVVTALLAAWAFVLQIGLQMFQNAETGDPLGSVMACTVLVSLPVLILYVFFAKANY